MFSECNGDYANDRPDADNRRVNDTISKLFTEVMLTFSMFIDGSTLLLTTSMRLKCLR